MGIVSAMLEMVEVAPHPPERFESVLEPEPFEKLAGGIHEARELLGERTVWNVSSTAKGGGVVELLLPLIGYAKGAGVDARWAVIEGNPEFFKVTKRIHNHLHGFEGDGGKLDDEARKTYEDALEANASELVDLVKDGDIVLLHDPQTAGLIGPLKRTGAKVVWRCHIGVDEPDDLARGAWDFLRVDVEQADAYVFSREAFVWEGLDEDRVRIIAPSIDAFNAKNQELEPGQVDAILAAAGIVDDADGEPTFTRGDGSEARVESQAELFEDTRLTTADKIVLQVSRWDRLKDPEGVIRGFAEHSCHDTGAHLVYAGLAVDHLVLDAADGETGVLLEDPEDLDAYGTAVRGLLEDPERAQRLGTAAKLRIRDEFLGSRSLLDYLSLIATLLA